MKEAKLELNFPHMIYDIKKLKLLIFIIRSSMDGCTKCPNSTIHSNLLSETFFSNFNICGDIIVQDSKMVSF